MKDTLQPGIADGRRFKPYPSYNESGVDWLGKIPAHWEVKRAKWSVTSGRTGGALIKGTLFSEPQEGLYPGFSAAGQDVWVEVPSYNEPGIVLSAVGARCGKAFKADGRWTAVANTHVLLPRKGQDRDFLWRIFDDETFWQKGGAAQPYIDVTESLNRAVAFPPLAEQRAITAFLDCETAKIDALVAKKERLIELLQGKRAALITQAVTKGLDPAMPMKDSGVEWLGRVPAHWKVSRNKILFWEHDQRSLEGEEKLLTVSHLTGVTRRSEKEVYMIEAESHEGYKLCETGDLIINTMWAWMGALGIAGESGMVSPSYNVYRFRGQAMLPRYYDYLCRIPSHVSELTRYSKGVWKSRLRLYPEEFYAIFSPVPERMEQQAIVEHLDRETATIDGLVAKVREGIEKLKEYRTALISAAVTGKINVR